MQFGREVCGNLEHAESREWLVTNGLGGYASGTVAGTTTRKYHGLLVAALDPPVNRVVLVNSIDESARYLESVFPLGANRWKSGFVSPRGFLQIESFHLEGSKPVWRYALADALLEKRVWMAQGENTTYVQYSLLRGRAPVEISGKVLVNYRGSHGTTHPANWQMRIDEVEHGLRVKAFDDAAAFYLKCPLASWTPRHEWYRDFFLSAEHERGLDDSEDRLYAGRFQFRLHLGESVTLVLSTEESASLDGEQARTGQSNHDLHLFQAWQSQRSKTCASAADDEPGWFWQLVLAADQFIVQRSFPGRQDGKTIIAGYPWFNDWGRDTMIALPGLTLATGRPEMARSILRSFTHYLDGGLLPNYFPDSRDEPRYNTVDATLWLFQAVREFYQATQDLEFVREMMPFLSSIIEHHLQGTRFNIKVDPADGLLATDNTEVQLTWMDAKIGDWIVTPRTGKAVEINALWINALHAVASFARPLGEPPEQYEVLAAKATHSFQKFWNEDRQCCFDVIDTPAGPPDASLRPNQVFAVSLPVSPLSPDQRRAVVDFVAEQLLTSHGLRSLSPSEPGYRGQYNGGQRERDSAYHQGTVWGWLLGPFALAHYRVYHDAAVAQSFLEPLGRTIASGGLGTLGEIYDGDPPYAGKGCIAQAWTVAEVFRVWQTLSAAISPVQ